MKRLTRSEMAGHAVGESALPRVAGYAVEEWLGEGGMGVVYRARELETDRVVALKMLKRMDPNGIYRLKREFRTLVEIAHPNLVRLHALRCVDDAWFFTMELIEGRAFLEFLGVDPWRSSSPPPSGLTATVDGPEASPASRDQRVDDERVELLLRSSFSQLVQGIAAVHRAGKIHCDIKPSNLMVDATARVVVLDFGVSSFFGQSDPLMTLETGMAGTPEYMSPEQIAGEPLGPPSDLHAVGAVLYEALSGTRPFSGPRQAMMDRKLREMPPPPSSVRPVPAKDLESLCMDLLARRPEERPTAREVLARLGHSLRPGQSIPPTLLSAYDSAVLPERSSPPPSSIRPSIGLVGRTAELAWLSAAANDVGPSRPVVAIVTGASGVGKSALVDTFAREVSVAPTVLLHGRCYESESVPFKAFD